MDKPSNPKLKPSFYNYYYEGVVWNSFSGAVGIYKSHEIDMIKSDPDNLDPELKKETLDNGFVVGYDVDEFGRAEYSRITNMVNNRKYCSVAIVPTTACNARCWYCSQEGIKFKTMSDETVDRTIEFVKQYVLGSKELEITWYGGEPLLEWDKIKKISKAIIQFCDSKGIKYTSSLISNGAMLSKHLDELEDIRLTHIQIPIDGYGEDYQKTKAYVSNGCTYEELKSACKSAMEKEIEIIFRLNVYQNVESVKKAAEDLKNTYGDKLPYGVTFAMIFDQRSGNLLLNPAEGQKLYDGFEFAGNLKKNQTTVASSRICIGLAETGLAIGPDGEFYKCQKAVGNPTQVIGNLKDGITPNECYYAWRLIKPLDKCKTCKGFPICGGGCAYFRVTTNTISERKCEETLLELEDRVKDIYRYYSKECT